MKMAELERRSGVGRETIRYYIREGLLPEPERRARNVAVYGDVHAAARTFQRYTCCRQDYLNRFAIGTTLESLIVA